MKPGNFKGKKITVMGLARSGVGAANLLSHLGAEVLVTDIRDSEALRENIGKLRPSISVVAGKHPDEIFSSADLIVVSPGVPRDLPPLLKARSRGIPVIGELELAYQVVRAESGKSGVMGQKGRKYGYREPRFMGVTGTNGKSTTAVLLDLMLRKSGFQTLLCGNIGYALSEELYRGQVGGKQLQADCIVTEISSFQLETIQNFRPSVAVLLNITPDHLDRYGTLQNYIDAKARIWKNQRPSDYLILNADDPRIMKMAEEKMKRGGKRLPHLLFFSRTREVEGLHCTEHNLHLSFLSTSKAVPFPRMRKGTAFPPLNVIGRSEIRISGVHNLENAMAASLAALVAGCSLDSVRTVLRTFPGLEHRLEFVREAGGVKFINDSKGTNVGATTRSIESLQNIVLIMGGRDKGGDFSTLRDVIQSRVKKLILIGEARDKISRQLGEGIRKYSADSLEEAVEVSFREACPGDTVLLSPACASFDMFSDFEERGKMFKKAVFALPAQGIH